MAQLQSPGVSVTVIDESFYTPAAPGTVPLIVVASEESKPNSSGTGIAPGTLKANAGQVYLLTSQKDLSDTFGTPIFQTDANNNPIHAGELNEYGLQAAYSFLGVSNSAYVVRADLDLAQLVESTQAPAGLPADGTVWIDTIDTQFGIFQWNSSPGSTLGGQTFSVQKPNVITDNTLLDEMGAPKTSFGAIGSYAVVAITSLITVWFKKPATTVSSPVQWVEVGSSDWVASWPTAQGMILESGITLLTSDTFTINGQGITDITTLSELVTQINTGGTLSTPLVDGISAAIIQNKLQIYSTGADIVVSGSSVAKVGLTVGTYLAPALSIQPHTQVPQYKITSNLSSVNGVPTGSVWVKTTTPNAGAHWVINRYSSTAAAWSLITAPLYANNLIALQSMDSTGGGNNLPINTIYVKFNDSETTVSEHGHDYPGYADFKLYRRNAVGSTSIKSGIITSSSLSDNTYTFTIEESIIGSSLYQAAVTISFVVSNGDTGPTVADAISSAINTAGFTNIVSTVNGSNQIVIDHFTGGDF